MAITPRLVCLHIKLGKANKVARSPTVNLLSNQYQVVHMQREIGYRLSLVQGDKLLVCYCCILVLYLTWMSILVLVCTAVIWLINYIYIILQVSWLSF